MKIVRHIKVPTGDILVIKGEKGHLEMLALGDYGKDVNLNQHKEVQDNIPIMPLSEKFVVTISTQYGCSQNCTFCDVPKVGKGVNATLNDLTGEIETALSLPHAPKTTKRLNVHFARMGEPTYNENVLHCSSWLIKNYRDMHPHPVVSTMMPNKNKKLSEFINKWMFIKNAIYSGNAGLQLSINSTDPIERDIMFSGNSLSIEKISEMMKPFTPIGRKITLNFAVAGYKVDCEYLAKLFSPNYYICKITPMHKTVNAVFNKIQTQGNYTTPEPYMELEENLQKAGFETLVFIASRDEDDGRITCGNAILSGTMPKKYSIIK